MTDQKAKLIETSELIRDHLTKQNAPAMVEKECVYKAPNGNMCAVGCLIKPEYYDEDFEGQGIDEYPIQDAVAASVGLEFNRELGCDDPAYVLLSSWQAYHDEEYSDFVGGGITYFGQPARSPAEFHELVINPETLETVCP